MPWLRTLLLQMSYTTMRARMYTHCYVRLHVKMTQNSAGFCTLPVHSGMKLLSADRSRFDIYIYIAAQEAAFSGSQPLCKLCPAARSHLASTFQRHQAALTIKRLQGRFNYISSYKRPLHFFVAIFTTGLQEYLLLSDTILGSASCPRLCMLYRRLFSHGLSVLCMRACPKCQTTSMSYNHTSIDAGNDIKQPMAATLRPNRVVQTIAVRNLAKPCAREAK